MEFKIRKISNNCPKSMSDEHLRQESIVLSGVANLG